MVDLTKSSESSGEEEGPQSVRAAPKRGPPARARGAPRGGPSKPRGGPQEGPPLSAAVYSVDESSLASEETAADEGPPGLLGAPPQKRGPPVELFGCPEDEENLQPSGPSTASRGPPDPLGGPPLVPSGGPPCCLSLEGSTSPKPANKRKPQKRHRGPPRGPVETPTSDPQEAPQGAPEEAPLWGPQGAPKGAPLGRLEEDAAAGKMKGAPPLLVRMEGGPPPVVSVLVKKAPF
ncbi:hypothetical protein, conserved [Eimeria tenella]|uniref:Uncharacterized protein n=1 Tax=Eimeria tenella TaxID=5802 RepID=U6L923_EIMTE|nr:hypothetical protein, conserved [Eimeria tenella]CDJ44290.1 hypothetical protein, conserved [Eimeria tenella]|eukprot:XP_013235039.1 hypothetical protein, conserved [Eimeria tenella]